MGRQTNYLFATTKHIPLFEEQDGDILNNKKEMIKKKIK